MSDAPRDLPEIENALKPGTRLGEFEIKRQLGAGGFGIVYLAFDHRLEREVAIKEYMPASLAGRTESMHVSLRSTGDKETFEIGRRSFINEAKLLARFDHPSLIKVYRFWEANDTAYMVMPVLRGQTFKQIRQTTGRGLGEAWVREMLASLLGALEQLHRENVYHRDIAPDNVHLDGEGRPVLLDLGAARHAVRDKTQPLTAILKPAYAPIEQYGETPDVKQGPWTDLYSLGATMHYMLLGHPPAPATARIVHNEASELAQRGVAGCSKELLAVLDWMLAPRPQDRPQSVAELRAVLEGKAARPRRTTALPGPTVAMAAAAADQPMVTVPLGDTRAAAEAGTRKEPSLTAEPARAPVGSRIGAGPGGAGDALRADAAHRLPPPAARSRLWAWLLIGLLLVGLAGAYGWQRFGAATGLTVSAAPAAGAGGDAAAAPMASAHPASSAASGSTPAPASGPAADASPSRDTAGPAPSAFGQVATAASGDAPGAPASGSATGSPPGGARVQSPATGPRVAPLAEGSKPPAARPPRAASPEADEADGASPGARCGGRLPLSRHVCMERLCERPRFTTHPECIAWRAQARPRDGAARP